MIELSKAQQEALDQTPSEILELIDPRTQRKYVLLRAAVYQDMSEMLDKDDDLDRIDGARLINEAMREDDENDPWLESYQEHKDQP